MNKFTYLLCVLTAVSTACSPENKSQTDELPGSVVTVLLQLDNGFTAEGGCEGTFEYEVSAVIGTDSSDCDASVQISRALCSGIHYPDIAFATTQIGSASRLNQASSIQFSQTDLGADEGQSEDNWNGVLTIVEWQDDMRVFEMSEGRACANVDEDCVDVSGGTLTLTGMVEVLTADDPSPSGFWREATTDAKLCVQSVI